MSSLHRQRREEQFRHHNPLKARQRKLAPKRSVTSPSDSSEGPVWADRPQRTLVQQTVSPGSSNGPAPLDVTTAPQAGPSAGEQAPVVMLPGPPPTPLPSTLVEPPTAQPRSTVPSPYPMASSSALTSFAAYHICDNCEKAFAAVRKQASVFQEFDARIMSLERRVRLIENWTRGS